MKLIRFGPVGAERPGLIDQNGQRRDLSHLIDDFDGTFFNNDGLQQLAALSDDEISACPIVAGSVRLGPPVAQVPKIVCVGLNYARHARESGMGVPEEPVLFFKSTTAICGPNDDLVIPKNSRKTDWEVELAVIIGKRAGYVEEADAMDYVAGYTVHNDYSEREFQLEKGGQWVKGKSCDTFAPIGPFLATKDEIKDPHNLNLWLKLNGKMMQNSTTADLIFNIPHLIHYISQYMTLLPGDIISTGTPSGVGLGLSPQQYLKPGDVVELGIEGLGSCSQTARAYTQ
jgi:2-keto-4-pentenoate hydratase/2-oxohepta-3-ene-1,7-dioic acid hydratase in catechol pathway